MTQINMLRAHYSKAGAKLTQLDALIAYGIGRLAPRIAELEAIGYLFAHNMIKVAKKNGYARVCEYVLIRAPEVKNVQ